MVSIVIAQAGGDPLALARLGTRFSQGDPNGSEGYDGQFVYYIARDPRPESVAPLLDVPAYRYQRILLPLMARVISFGNEDILPWALALLGILAQGAGTWAVAEILQSWGVNRWYALVYGLWAGSALAVRLDLPEPLAYGLAAAALLAELRGHRPLSWFLYALALFAKEVIALFVLAQILADLLKHRWRPALGLGLVSVLPYMLFQLWLWKAFGEAGIGSGGAMATPFEFVPYMGLWRIGAYSLVYLLAMCAVFGPAIVLPSIWGIWNGLKSLFTGERNVIVLVLFIHAVTIACMPFSTFRETGGLLRFSCGLVLSVLLFAGRYHKRKTLNYSVLWMVLNVFLFK